jgi:hypothetical protein
MDTMSTKVSLKYESDETTGGSFHLYREVLEDEYVYIEFEGVPFEAANSPHLSDEGLTSVTIRIPDAWARKLGLIKRPKTPSRSEPLQPPGR